MTRWLVAPILCAALCAPTAAQAAPSPAPPVSEPAPVVTTPPAADAAPQPAVPVQPTATQPAPSAPPPPAVQAPAPPPPVITTAPASPPAPQGPQRDKRAEPMVAAGFSTFGGIYMLTAYAGAATIDRAREISRNDWQDGNGAMTRNRGRALLIPVAGPFIAMRFTNSARRKYWQAVNGGLQATSLAIGLLGARMFRKHRKAQRRAQVTAAASREGAQLGMTMRF